MQLLLAEDDRISREVAQSALKPLEIDLATADDGLDAWDRIQRQLPDIILLDWRMPGATGLEICRRLRTLPARLKPWVIMLTANTEPDDIVAAFASGADDYVTKPYAAAELRARVRAGMRRLEQQQALLLETAFLQDAVVHLREAPGLVPICSSCRRVRDTEGEWMSSEHYLSTHNGVHFTHGLCPPCLRHALDDATRDVEEP